jgi:hypothetical protein
MGRFSAEARAIAEQLTTIFPTQVGGGAGREAGPGSGGRRDGGAGGRRSPAAGPPPTPRFAAAAAPAAQAPKPKASDAAAAAAAAAQAAGAAAAEGAAAAGREGVFQLGEGGGRIVRGVGHAAPVEDFESLLGQGLVDDALGGMQVGGFGGSGAGGARAEALRAPAMSSAGKSEKHAGPAPAPPRRLALHPAPAPSPSRQAVVPQLVEESVGGRLYSRAASCMARLRAACVERGRPAVYNALLTQASAGRLPHCPVPLPQAALLARAAAAARSAAPLQACSRSFPKHPTLRRPAPRTKNSSWTASSRTRCTAASCSSCCPRGRRPSAAPRSRPAWRAPSARRPRRRSRGAAGEVRAPAGGGGRPSGRPLDSTPCAPRLHLSPPPLPPPRPPPPRRQGAGGRGGGGGGGGRVRGHGVGGCSHSAGCRPSPWALTARFQPRRPRPARP